MAQDPNPAAGADAPVAHEIHTFALTLDGKGGGAPWERGPAGEAGLHWVHLNSDDREDERWLREASGLSEPQCDSLLAEATRPLAVPTERGVLVILRGLFLMEGAYAGDMVSLRLWVTPDQMVSLCRRPVKAVERVAEDLRKGRGPWTSADLMTQLIDHLQDPIGQALEELDERLDGLEEAVDEASNIELNLKLADQRRHLIALRRYLVPQRDALASLSLAAGRHLGDECRATVQFQADQVARFVEALDELRDRALVVHDLSNSRQAERMNQRMLVLSLAAGLCLPLGLLTGLLGINVGGMPGVDTPYAFWVVCGAMVALTVTGILALRRVRWI
ncbi:MAG: CorA family divalent cation transporter [Planctomycetota bacterium]